LSYRQSRSCLVTLGSLNLIAAFVKHAELVHVQLLTGRLCDLVYGVFSHKPLLSGPLKAIL